VISVAFEYVKSGKGLGRAPNGSLREGYISFETNCNVKLTAPTGSLIVGDISCVCLVEESGNGLGRAPTGSLREVYKSRETNGYVKLSARHWSLREEDIRSLYWVEESGNELS
jgi:hypothetical protein